MTVTNPDHNLLEAKRRTWLLQGKFNSIIEFGKNLEADPKREERHKRNLCQLCFYGPPKIAGQAFTDTTCGGCREPMQFSNTHVDRLCPACASKRGCCKECGAHIDLKDFDAFPADDGR